MKINIFRVTSPIFLPKQNHCSSASDQTGIWELFFIAWTPTSDTLITQHFWKLVTVALFFFILYTCFFGRVQSLEECFLFTCKSLWCCCNQYNGYVTPEKYSCLLSLVLFQGSTYPKSVWFDLENSITGKLPCRLACTGTRSWRTPTLRVLWEDSHVCCMLWLTTIWHMSSQPCVWTLWVTTAASQQSTSALLQRLRFSWYSNTQNSGYIKQGFRHTI